VGADRDDVVLIDEAYSLRTIYLELALVYASASNRWYSAIGSTVNAGL
jgi:hypothetical protein